jgi:hypothetical protein
LQVTDYVLPDALVQSEDFRELNPKQVDNFVARLSYISEVADTIEEALASNDQQARDIMDDVELDVAQLLSVYEDPEARVSPWLVHSSWTFSAPARDMRGCLPRVVVDALNQDPPSINGNPAQFTSWLRLQSRGLRISLKSLPDAPSLSAAIGLCIAMDTILSAILVGICRARLNPSLCA